VLLNTLVCFHLLFVFIIVRFSDHLNFLSFFPGAELARALTNYDSAQIAAIRGKSSKEFAALLGYSGTDEIASRFNIAVGGV
jgi:glutamate 5-kinase